MSNKYDDLFGGSSPMTDAPTPSASPSGSNSFGGETFGAGNDATRTPVCVEEVQYADLGESTADLDVFSPATSIINR